MALLKKAAKKAAKGAAKGAAKKGGASSSNFELLHPRARKGLPNAGEFVDVQGRLAAMGGKWDPDSGAWKVPKDKRPDLEALLDEINFEAVAVPDGMRVATPEDLDTKFAGKKIPPGWVDVMIAKDPTAAIQVRGRDSVGRVVSIRAKDADANAAAEKFARIKLLDEKMPDLDARLNLEAQGDDTAAAVMLVRKMGLRPGSLIPTGAKDQAYGASTLQRRHVEVNGDTVRLRFVGKEGIWNDLSIKDRQMAQVLGARLLGREGDDPIFPGVTDRKMNTWIAGTAGKGFSNRDFRTHRATGEARMMVAQMRLEQPDLDPRMLQLAVGAHVAGVLGNTREEALRTYIDPAVFDSGLAFAPAKSAAQKTAIAKKAWETRRAKAGAPTPSEPAPGVRDSKRLENAPEPAPAKPSTPAAVVEAGGKHNLAIQRDPRVVEAKERQEKFRVAYNEEMDKQQAVTDRGETPNYRASMAIHSEYMAAKLDVAAARTVALTQAMAARRSLGGGPEPIAARRADQKEGPAKKLVGTVKRAMDELPSEWFPGPTIKVLHNEEEAYWNDELRLVVASNQYDAMHELGHVVESSYAPVGDLVDAFFAERVKDFPLVKSRSGWQAYKGAFPVESYMERYYPKGHTEVLSITLQQLLRDAVIGDNVWDDGDPEVRDFVLGLLMEV